MATAILDVPTPKDVSGFRSSSSPYADDNLVLLSRVTEKTLVQKGSTFRSTSNKVYKANSDHLDSIYAKSNKKSKKSVLTLPNEPDLMPQECTVSDINDSDYFKKEDEQRKWRSKCRFPVRYNKNAKQRIARTDYQETVWNSAEFKGDQKKKTCKTAAHDVWALLRNMNRFQYQPSPPMSDDSFEFKKQKPIIQKKRNTRYIETCHTEEIEYTITSYDLDKQFSKNPSPSSPNGQNINTNENSGFKAPEITKEIEENKVSEILTEKDKNEILNDADDENMIIPAENTISNTNNVVELNKVICDVTNIENHVQNTILPVTSLETLKNKDSNSNTTLTQSLEVSSVGTATSSKFYSNAEKPNLYPKEPQNVVENETLNLNVTKKNTKESERKNKINKNIRTMDLPAKFDSSKIKNMKNSEFTSTSNSSRTTNAARKAPQLTYTKTNENLESYEILPKTSSTEYRKDIKIKDATNNTTKIYDIYRGKLDQVSSEELKNKNLYRKPHIVDVKEIRRTLANMRFPVMITGKDQISSIKIANSHFSQFAGLESQIWPFMSEWLDIKKAKPNSRKIKTSNNASQVSEQYEQRMTKKKFLDQNHGKLKSEANNISEEEKFSYPKSIKVELKGKTNLKQSSDIACIDPQKATNFNNLKNKVKKLLGKKSTNTIGTTITHSDQEELSEDRKLELQQPMTKIVIKNKCCQNVVNVGFGEDNLNHNRKKYSSSRIVGNHFNTESFQKTSQSIEHQQNKNKRVWSKAKWANDVIDNVLKKMKNGFYYMNPVQVTTQEKERDIIIPIIHDESSTSVTYKDFNNSIPGFDEPLPALEVETLSMNEISIKQCVTNLTIRFDIIVPNTKDALTTRSKTKCQPAETTSALPGILNWQTTILNTVLPAELCSVIPKMMRKFSETSLKLPSPSVTVSKLTKTEPQLATIAEMSRYESGILSLLPILGLSANVSKYLNGLPAFNMKFTKDNHRPGNVGIGGLRVNCKLTDVSLVFPKTTLRIPCNVEIPFAITSNFQQHSPSQKLGETNVSNTQITTNCSNANNLAVSTIMKFDLISVLNKLIEYRDILAIKTDVSFKSPKITEIALKIHDNICNNFLIRTPRLTKKEIMLFSSHNSLRLRNSNVNCNSSQNDLTSKQEEKSYTLYTITNLEEFIQILGSGPALSSVFDEKAGKKIMSCIFKMRKWVAKIDSKQAMLIILLINKYDSQDLVKYGTKLLKGIAEKKITNTCDLQKEIDALKKRKLEYERNQAITFKETEKEDLFQELYWIAKSAANHSNGNFDDHAEEKLRMFLERRRQLNPSFLRAMATYLGLGLLTVDLEETRKVDNY